MAGNNQLAFDVAEREFGIQPVTTGKEMAADSQPDKLLMVLYLSKFYEAFRNSPANKGQLLPHRTTNRLSCFFSYMNFLNSIMNNPMLLFFFVFFKVSLHRIFNCKFLGLETVALKPDLLTPV